VAASPVFAGDDTVYVASTGGTLFAVTSKGEKKWEAPTDAPIFATPAIDQQGNVYVADLSGTLYSFSPAGKEQWRFSIARSLEKRITSPILVAPDGNIWFGSWDSNVYVVSPTGKQQQFFSTGKFNYAALTSDGAALVCVAQTTRRELTVEAYETQTFTKRWTGRSAIDSGQWPVMAASAIDLGRRHVYAAGVGGQQGLLVCFDLGTGTPLWRKTPPRGVYSTPAIAPDGSVVIGDLGGTISCYSPDDGEQKWQFQTDAYVILGSATIDANGTVLIGAGDGNLYVLDSSGKELWRHQTGTNISASPAIGDEGAIYVSSFDGYLHAIGAPQGVLDCTVR
jgi:outer membrane protein assembly factor BamB